MRLSGLIGTFRGRVPLRDRVIKVSLSGNLFIDKKCPCVCVSTHTYIILLTEMRCGGEAYRFHRRTVDELKLQASCPETLPDSSLLRINFNKRPPRRLATV